MKTDSPVQLEKLVSIRKIQEAWDISRTTVYELINDGTFRVLKIKGATRIRLSEVIAYTEKQLNK